MERVVFTNGCFDVIHCGHVRFLSAARGLGDRLIVGLNSDASVRAIKGPDRPVNDEDARKCVLEGLRSVDEVVIFEENTPQDLIQRIKPDVLVKGGDWSIEQIVGGEFVRRLGGEVVSLPLTKGFSSTHIIDRLSVADQQIQRAYSGASASLAEHASVTEAMLKDHLRTIETCGEIICETFQNGGKLIIAGNGGSAADAQHIAAEFVGRYEIERRALPAIAITTDTSAITALANDYDFDRIFARQIDALAASGDCLVAISTSGNSPNILSAVMAARRLGCRVIAMTGAGGRRLAGLADAALIAPSKRTARIQEMHITVAHIWCEMVDARFAEAV